MRGTQIAFLFVALMAVACSSDDKARKSEPAGRFDVSLSQHKDADTLGACDISAVEKNISSNCEMIPTSIHDQTHVAATGVYTFTSDNSEAISVKITRTASGSVLCKAKFAKPSVEYVGTETTTLIYVANDAAASDLSCNNTTAVWIKKKFELQTGEVLEEKVQPLL